MKTIIYSDPKEKLELYEANNEQAKKIETLIINIGDKGEEKNTKDIQKYILFNMTNIKEIHKDFTFDKIDDFFNKTVFRKNFFSEIILYIQNFYQLILNEQLYKVNIMNSNLKLIELSKNKEEMFENINKVMKLEGINLTVEDLLKLKK